MVVQIVGKDRKPHLVAIVKSKGELCQLEVNQLMIAS